MKKLYWIVAALAAGFGLSMALAQTIAVPQDPSLTRTDLTQVIPSGVPSARSVYYPSAALGGLEFYIHTTPVTGFTITPLAHTSFLYLTPAGTLATGTLTMEPNPSDGQRLCVLDTQTQSAITIAGNTGQIIGVGIGLLTALTANTTYCYMYEAPLTSWTRIR